MDKDSVKKYIKLAEAQKHVGRVVKTKKNAFTNSKYADLEAVIEAIDLAREKVDFCLVDTVVGEGEEFLLRTSFVCEEGDISVEAPMPYGSSVKSGNEMHKIGSAFTYLRRYNRQNLFNIAAEDDDGNKAKDLTPKKATEKEAPKKDSSDDNYVIKKGVYAGKAIKDVDPKALDQNIKQAIQFCEKNDKTIPDEIIKIDTINKRRLGK